jgi:hypothetical protein
MEYQNENLKDQSFNKPFALYPNKNLHEHKKNRKTQHFKKNACYGWNTSTSHSNKNVHFESKITQILLPSTLHYLRQTMHRIHLLFLLSSP